MGHDNISEWCIDCETEAEDCRICRVPCHGEPSHHRGEKPIFIPYSMYRRLKQAEKELKSLKEGK